jgi:hypothetical protein
MRPMKRALFVCLVVVGVGCGSDDEEDTAAQAVAKCETFMTTFCSRAVECLGSAVITTSDCRQALATEVDCGKAVGVTSSYPRCIDQIQSFSCGTLFGGADIELPASCDMVIQLP